MPFPAEAASPERLTWPEIRERYPNQWVVLASARWSDDDGELESAVVVGQGADRGETMRSVDPKRADDQDSAAWHTGRVRAPFRPIYLLPVND